VSEPPHSLRARTGGTSSDSWYSPRVSSGLDLPIPPELEPLQRRYLFAIILRHAGALPYGEATAVRDVLLAASPDTVAHNPFTGQETPLRLAVLDLVGDV
jgi:hypothetical protein